MRVTAANAALRQFCGRPLRMGGHRDLRATIDAGYRLLYRITGVDLGFDILAWHEHLHRSSKRKGVPAYVSQALASEAWQCCADELKAKYAETSVGDQLAAERKRALQIANYWKSRERACPQCNCRFTSVQDRGQCPQCGHLFLASAIYATPNIGD